MKIKKKQQLIEHQATLIKEYEMKIKKKQQLIEHQAILCKQYELHVQDCEYKIDNLEGTLAILRAGLDKTENESKMVILPEQCENKEEELIALKDNNNNNKKRKLSECSFETTVLENNNNKKRRLSEFAFIPNSSTNDNNEQDLSVESINNIIDKENEKQKKQDEQIKELFS